MQRDESGLVVSPTDLTKFLACRHITTRDLAVADGARGKPWVPTDELLQLLFKKGIEHETRVLETMRLDRDVEIIDAPLVAAVAATEAAMARGAEVIYQADVPTTGVRGHADFLCRADRPSRLGNWSYDVADTKLARRLKVPALLQMAAYGEHLRRIQGDPPRTLTVIAGDAVEHAVAFRRRRGVRPAGPRAVRRVRP